jgi:biuret amidohydrolase
VPVRHVVCEDCEPFRERQTRVTETSTTASASKREALLRSLLEPQQTAVLTMELQEGVVGDQALMPALVDEVRRTGLLDVVRRVCDAARDAGSRVVHCTAVSRPDGAGSATNSRIFAMNERMRREQGGSPIDLGTPGAELVAGLEDPRDIGVPRLHGMTPFTSTSLDQILRNLGVRTVVATGVSLNLGVFGMVLSALDLGYQVVLVRDGVAGVPVEYAEAVLEHSLSLVATIVTSDELLATWAAVAAR